jgi:hypothetical protein
MEALQHHERRIAARATEARDQRSVLHAPMIARRRMGTLLVPRVPCPAVRRALVYPCAEHDQGLAALLELGPA